MTNDEMPVDLSQQDFHDSRADDHFATQTDLDKLRVAISDLGLVIDALYDLNQAPRSTRSRTLSLAITYAETGALWARQALDLETF